MPVSPVGRTALMVAAARAIEGTRPDALACDRFAEAFVRADEIAAGWPVSWAEVPDGDADPLWGRLARYFGLRTRVLDDFLLRAARDGIRQIVLLGAGFDTRAFRLGWPPGCRFFELDRAEILVHKQWVINDMAAQPVAERATIAVDLRDEWAKPLQKNGFDPALRTAWLVEGLLLYLPGDAERRLFDAVHQLSAPGSVLGYEIKLTPERPVVQHSPIYRHARERIGLDLLGLFDYEPRPESAADLMDRGWAMQVRTPFHFTTQYGAGPRPLPGDALEANRWIFGRRSPG